MNELIQIKQGISTKNSTKRKKNELNQFLFIIQVASTVTGPVAGSHAAAAPAPSAALPPKRSPLPSPTLFPPPATSQTNSLTTMSPKAVTTTKEETRLYKPKASGNSRKNKNKSAAVPDPASVQGPF